MRQEGHNNYHAQKQQADERNRKRKSCLGTYVEEEIYILQS